MVGGGETGRSRGTHRRVGAAGGDFRADILAVKEAVREAGERCKTTFMAGKNLVEHHEQLQDYDGKWHALKTERPAGSMRHFRTGPSNSGFQPRRSRSKEELGASCGSRWRLSSAGIATTGSRSTTYCAAHRAGLWQQPPSRNRQKTHPSSGLTVGVASESRRPKTV